jgi:4'-phosphopantetheinyl transferase
MGLDQNRWEQPEARVIIQPGEVHLWRVRLDGVGTDDEILWGFLSANEQERAHRFRFDLLRQRFLRTHAISRNILARYQGIPAGDLAIQTLPEGKPYLADSGGLDLKFNLSHSGDLMVMGVSRQVEVGVDVEVHSDSLDWRQIARSYFQPAELETLEKIEGGETQKVSFYLIWTMKEAYLKACGQGIAAGLRQTIVNLKMGFPPVFETLPGGDDEIRRWQVILFQPATGASGAVVIERGSEPYRIIRYDWSSFTRKID